LEKFQYTANMNARESSMLLWQCAEDQMQ